MIGTLPRAAFGGTQMTIENPYGGLGAAASLGIKRKIFVSYHHGGDQQYYETFSKTFADTYDMIYDNSLERKIDSDDAEYILRQIREKYLTGTSCTVVLVGASTWGRKFVDWEIEATLQKQHGLIGLVLPTLPIVNNTANIPDRFWDNVSSGYAHWQMWSDLLARPRLLTTWITEATAKDKALEHISAESNRGFPILLS